MPDRLDDVLRQLAEEVIPQDSPLLRLVEAYGKAVDFPDDLAGLPPREHHWLERLEASLVVPLSGRDGMMPRPEIPSCTPFPNGVVAPSDTPARTNARQ